MFEAIALLFPNIIGVSIIDYKKKLNIKEFLLYYSLITIVVNCIICLSYYLYKKELFVYFTCMFFIKYCLLSIVLNILLGLLLNWLQNNFKVVFRRKK
jgi:hypothetical protein